jgi:folate-binding protein YgfZ
MHDVTGAQFEGDAALPRSYGNLRAEYQAVREGVALLDFSIEGKLQVSGKNAVQFINGLVTNEIKSLLTGQGAVAAFLDVHGKVSALARIYQTNEGLLLHLDATRRERVFKNLSRFVLAGEFFLSDLTDELALLSLQGREAAQLLESLTGHSFAEAADVSIQQMTMAEIPVRVAVHARCGEAGFDIFAPEKSAAQLWEMILNHGKSFGVQPVGQEAFDIARIESGVPREGIDVSEAHILLEAGFDNAVSYTKGCYLGQEIIARIHWRGQPARRLLRLDVQSAEIPPAGAELFAEDGKKVGAITSSARNPMNDRIAALGYVHRYYLSPGTELSIRQQENEIGKAIIVSAPVNTEMTMESK